MQTRVAFNSGEFAPEMAIRYDVDPSLRALDVLENWEVSPMGGIKRRRGMRQFARISSGEDKLFPFIYSYAPASNERFLVLVSANAIRVYDPETGTVIARFSDGDEDEDTGEVLTWHCTPRTVRAYQINKLLILTSAETPPYVLEYDGSEWLFKQWRFKNRPYRYNHEDRDYPIIIRINGDDAEVTFHDNEDEDELPLEDEVEADYMQASFYLDQQELESSNEALRTGVSVVSEVPASATTGQAFAVALEDEVKYYVCVHPDGWPVKNYVAGLESPANYSSYFQPATDIDADFVANAKAIYTMKDLQESGTVALGTKVAFKSSYWEYWYCFKNFEKPADGSSEFADYPEYFWHGLPVGTAGTCKGTWSFYCSGVWYGKYEILRNYDTSDINANWELRGTSFSRNFAASNTMPTGDESGEECYLRLRLVMSRRQNEHDSTQLGAKNILKGFPQDDCANRLIISSYKHNTVLKYTPAATAFWSVVDNIRPALTYTRQVYDWSWQAFSKRYGYPMHATLLNSRLVFAATNAQPQTLWMSCTDDIDNFMTGDTESSSLWLTLNTTSQNPICWLQEQNQKLYVATAATENIIQTVNSGQVLSNNNAILTKVGYVGSSDTPALLTANNVLYISRGGGRVYQFSYSLDADGMVSTDLCVFASHIAEEHGGFGLSAMASKPDAVAYFVMGDGSIALCTYDAMQKVNAWHRWTTAGTVRDVCVLPDGLKHDRVFFLVERDGVPYIEVVDEESEYVDNGDVDYTSTFITNALGNPLSEAVRKTASMPFAICFRDEVDLTTGLIEMSTDGGGRWMEIATHRPYLEAGWHDNLIAPSGWGFNRKIGLRVKGNRGIHILGLQG